MTLRKLRSQDGFSMIELMVTVSIFAMITALTLVNYPRFGSRILLDNTSYDVGLAVRQAQSYGLNVRSYKLGGEGDNIFPTYGAHFSLNGISEDDPSDNRNFLLFADILPDIDTPTENDKIYNGASDCSTQTGECVEQFVLQSTNSILLLCGNLKSSGATVETWREVAGADCSLSSLDITFTRPDPDAVLKGYSEDDGELTTFSDAEIVVSSPRGDLKSIVVWATGQIFIE